MILKLREANFTVRVGIHVLEVGIITPFANCRDCWGHYGHAYLVSGNLTIIIEVNGSHSIIIITQGTLSFRDSDRFDTIVILTNGAKQRVPAFFRFDKVSHGRPNSIESDTASGLSACSSIV